MTASLNRDLWYGTSGPRDAKIVFVGESWGHEEAVQLRPFVGSAGAELDRILARSGLQRDDILLTNVVAEKPDGNEMWRFFHPKASNPPRIGGVAPTDRVIGEVRRLYNQLASHPRSAIIAAGNWSLWALSNRTGAEVIRESNGRKVPLDLQTWGPTGITTWRGSMLYCEPHKEFNPPPGLAGTRLLPVIHPAAIMRQWSHREPTIHDLRTRVPMALRDDWRPKDVSTLAPPTFSEAIGYLTHQLEIAALTPFYLACDIETLRKLFITCIGFAADPYTAISIPFIHEVRDDGITSYWGPDQEAQIVNLIRKILTHPNIRLFGQNFIYDTQYIQHWMGITPRLHHDTMLGQNVLFPGTLKELSYLASLYCTYHWHWKEDVKDWKTLGDLNILLEYNCIDNMRTYEIGINQLDLIRKLGQEQQMQLKMDTHRLCLRMMNRGVRFDTTRRGPALGELMSARAEIQSDLLAAIPQDFVKPHTYKRDGTLKKGQAFWYSSAQQTAELFYDILGMNEIHHRKTGSRTVGKEALPVLMRKHPEFTAIFSRLEQLGGLDNVIDVINTKTESDGRVRCSYNPGGAESHRLSSSTNVFGRGTNFQNLTKGEEDE